MPKDKIQNNENRNSERTEMLRAGRKNIKNLVYMQWKTREMQKIESSVQLTQDAEDRRIRDEKVKIDQGVTRKLLETKEKIKKDWRDHLVEASAELKKIDEKFMKQMKEAFAVLDKEYAEKEKEAQKQYNEELKKLEEERKSAQEKVNQEKERLRTEQEKCSSEIERCWKELGEIGEAIGKCNEKSNRASKEVQKEMQKEIDEHQNNLKIVNARNRTWNETLRELQTEEKELDKELAAFGKRRQEAEKAYKQKLAGLSQEKLNKMLEEQAKVKAEKEKLQRQYDEDKARDFNPSRWLSLSEDIENQGKYDKMRLDQNRTVKADEKKKELMAQMNMTGKKLLHRLHLSVDFDIELDSLKNSSKSHGNGNTDEFNTMIEALEKAGKAVGEGEVSEKVEEDIRKSCLEAYKECQNYLQKKDRGWSLLEKLRSRAGKDRIEMARGMMNRLKEFYPGLEAALEAEKDLKNNVQEERASENRAEEKAPAGKPGGKQRSDVKGELERAKMLIREQQGKEKGQKNINQNTNRKTNQNTNKRQNVKH